MKKEFVVRPWLGEVKKNWRFNTLEEARKFASSHHFKTQESCIIYCKKKFVDGRSNLKFIEFV